MKKTLFIALTTALLTAPLLPLPPRFHGATAVAASPEKELGRRFLEEAAGMFDFITDPEVVKLVNDVGKEIVAAAGSDPDDYRFFVIRKNQINAFAVPGGYIFVYDGLLRQLNGVDALAGVLAHEVAHVERNHFFKDAGKLGTVDLATLAAIILAGFSGDSGAATTTVAQAANISYKLKLSREHEEDADSFAVKYLRNSRYDPEGLASFFATLTRFERLNVSENYLPYLSTHPEVDKRQLLVQAMVEKNNENRKKEKTGRPDWERMVTILEAGKDEGGGSRRSEGKDEGDRHEGEKEHYLGGLRAMKAHDFNGALSEYLKALSLNPDNPVYHADLAVLYMKLGKPEEAKKEAQRSIALSGDLASPYVVLATAARNEGRHKEAVKYFREAEKRNPYDPFVHYHMAGSYHELGMPAEARFHLGHYYRLNLDRTKALAQFRMALKEKSDADFRREIEEAIINLERNGI